MGYQRPLLKLTFDASTGDLEGFEVTFRRLSIGNLQTLLEMANIQAGKLDLNSTEGIEALDRAIENLATHTVTWNMEDEHGEPLMPDPYLNREKREAWWLEQWKALDPTFVMAVMNKWLEGVVGVDAPLPQRSSGIERSLEGSLPMEDPQLPLLSNIP